MADKVVEFLSKIGFTADEIVEFCRAEPDSFTSHGYPIYGMDELYALIYNNKISVDLIDKDLSVEHYWERGWFSEDSYLRRSNLDIYEGKWYKVFQTRYKLREFKFTKSLRRVLRKNSDLKTVISPLYVTREKAELFDTHHHLQIGVPPRRSLYEIFRDVSDNGLKKMDICVYKDDKLIACSIFEIAASAAFGHLAFWDVNESARSLGTLTLLLEVQYALSRMMNDYYFGIFYVQNPNYHYKARFGGFELYDWDNECWIAFANPKIKEMLRRKSFAG